MNLLEKYVIICHNKEKAEFYPFDNYFSYTIIGAVLLDLASQDYIKLENGYLKLLKTSRTNHPVYDSIINLIKASKKDRKIKHWIQRIYQKNWRIKRDTIEACAKNGIMRIERKKFLNIIPYKRYHLNSSSERRELIHQLRDVCLYKKEGTAETISLLGLIHAAQAYKALANEKSEIRTIKKNLKQLVKNELVSGVINSITDEINTAIIASIVATTAATTVVTSS